MIDLTKIDWRTPPGGIIQALTHRQYADWLYSTGKVSAVNRDQVAKVPDTGPRFGLIAASRLFQMGAKAVSTPPTDAARYLATGAYNAEFDIERGTMSAKEKPFDEYRELVEDFLAVLVQSLIDGQPTAPSPAAPDTKARDALARIAAIIKEVV